MRKEVILKKLRHAQRMVDECEQHIGDGDKMLEIFDKHGAERFRERFSKEEIDWLIRWMRWTMDVSRLENMLKGL
jgi:hypothetical protein